MKIVCLLLLLLLLVVGVRGGAISRTSLRWDTACIDVGLANNIVNRRAVFQSAIYELNTRTAACFNLLSSINDAPDGDWILVQAGDSCSSFVGRQPSCSYQVVTIASGCDAVSVIHEFMHALGAWHEQQRPDRDTYVDIRYENVVGLSSGQRAVNFDIHPAVKPFGPYDYDSVMHYRSTAFAARGTRTIVTRASGQQGRIDAVKTGLSVGDIATINELVKNKDGGNPPIPPEPHCSPAASNSTSAIILLNEDFIFD